MMSKRWYQFLIYNLIGSLILIFISYSCVPYKRTVFLNENIHPAGDTSSITAPKYRIQPGDVLSITVKAPDPNSVAIFNGQVGLARTAQANDISLYINGYVVTDSGNVNMPLIGPIKVVDKTIEEVTDTLNATLGDYYNHVEVDVKMTNFLISVLGEVQSPGTRHIYNPSYTLLQAIGGLTQFSDLKEVQVIREKNDKTHIAYVDLTDPNFINSDYYFVHPNDVIIVRHFKAKVQRINVSVVSIGLSVLSFILLLNNSFSK